MALMNPSTLLVVAAGLAADFGAVAGFFEDLRDGAEFGGIGEGGVVVGGGGARVGEIDRGAAGLEQHGTGREGGGQAVAHRR